MLIYKILTPGQMAELRASGSVPLAQVDVADGYVHLSTAEQAKETAEKHFADHAVIWLLAVPLDPLGEALVWEPSRGGALFPHFYGQLTAAHVAWETEVTKGADGFLFPDLSADASNGTTQ